MLLGIRPFWEDCVTDGQRVRDGLTRAVLEQESPRAAADRLCVACVELLEVDGAAVSLVHEGVTHGTFGSSGDVGRRLDELQFTYGEGPCLDSVRQARVISAPDLSDPHEARWPAFSGAALGQGVHAVFALPIALSSVPVGALDLFRYRRGALHPELLAGGLLAARLAAQPLTDHVAVSAQGESEGAWKDLERVEVYQATGMLMDVWDVGSSEALARLRAHAFALDVTASALAWAVVERRIVLGDDGEWPASGPRDAGGP